MTKMFGGYKGYPVTVKFKVQDCRDFYPERQR